MSGDRDPSEGAVEPEHDERQVQSIPLDTEDGGTVVIEQQNAGPGQQVGAGEYKQTDEVSARKSPDQAADEQAALEQAAPTDD
jgi:hypothetical protein